MTITAPGIYDLDDAAYHADPAPQPSASAGTLIRIHQATMVHAADEHPRLEVPGLPKKNNDEEESDPKFAVGAAGHSILTGKGGCIVEVDADSWRTNAAKDVRTAADKQGNTALLTDQAARVRLAVSRAREQLIANPDLRCDPFADREHNELAMIWQEGGFWFRAKPDTIHYTKRLIIDAKFTDGLADPDQWVLTQTKASLIHLRAAHYLSGAKHLLGPGWRYVFAVIEAKRPHCMSTLDLPGALLETGEDERRHAIAIWRRGITTGEFTGWARGINTAQAPAWLEAQWLERRERRPSQAARDIAMEAQAPR